MKIMCILETSEVAEYIQSRNLMNQYKKVKGYILAGHTSGAHLRKREPKGDNIWYFRINKKFRAFAYLDGATLKIFHIDDHQE